MKRRGFLKLVGLAIACPTQLSGDILSFVPTLRIILPFLKGTWYENKSGSGFWRFDKSNKPPIKNPVTFDNVTLRDESGKDYIGDDYCEQELIMNKDFTPWSSDEPGGWDVEVDKENFTFEVFLNGKLLEK